MKFIKSNSLLDGPVKGQNEFMFEIDATESNQLREALAIVQKYKKSAIKEHVKIYEHNPEKSSDWCMFDFCVKDDSVIVTISDGSCG